MIHKTPMLQQPLAALTDVDGLRVSHRLPAVVDAHVHVFPDSLFEAVWNWFEAHGWPIRHRLSAREVIRFLLERGVDYVVGLQYAHKPGIAAELNRFMLELQAEFPQLVGLATVFPGEPGAGAMLKSAFDQGLKGVKLHVHVQGFDMNGPELAEVYRLCADYDRPLLMHAGQEPKSPAYKHDPYELCDAGRVEQVLRDYPGLRLCVPHMGMNECEAYARLIEQYDNLWLDTTMALADYFPGFDAPDLRSMRIERIMYGSDFPNIPYAWDRELLCIERTGLPADQLALVVGENAKLFYGIS